MYRRKPVIVEARQLVQDDNFKVREWVREHNGELYGALLDSSLEVVMKLKTSEGPIVLRLGDWIIKDEDGCFTGRSNDSFEKEYESSDPPAWKKNVINNHVHSLVYSDIWNHRTPKGQGELIEKTILEILDIIK